MKSSNHNIIIVSALSLLGAIPVMAQEPFQDLDFESATVAPAPPYQFPGLVPVGAALPGWTAYLGSTQQSQVLYNATTLGEASISLLGPNWTSFMGLGPYIIDGNFSAVLQAGLDPATQTYSENVSIE